MAPENTDNPELQAEDSLRNLPWPTLIEGNATVEERREAIVALYDEVRKSSDMSPEMQFFACGQLATLRLLVDMSER